MSPPKPGRALLRTIAAYAAAGPWPALRAFWRFASAPLGQVAALLPCEGTIVEVGCGQGHFLRYCHERGLRRLVGIEPSERALRRARRCLPGSVSLVRGRAQELPVRSASCIVAIDVLYLLEPAQQEMFIAAASSVLVPGGLLLIKTMEPTRRLRQAVNRLQEWMAVRVLRITLGKEFSFRSAPTWEALCARWGMSARSVPLWRGYVHPHVLIVARVARSADDPAGAGSAHQQREGR